MKSLSLSAPHIIAMVGHPASGKTHFAEQFSLTFAAPFLNHQIFEELSTESRKIDAASQQILIEMMKTNQSIIFEGETNKRIDRTNLSKLAREHGYRVLFVWVQTAESTTKQRASRYSTEEYNRKMHEFSPLHETEKFVVISGRHTYSTQAKMVLEFLTKSRQERSIAEMTSPRSIC